MNHDTLCILWFGIMGVLLIGYAILDGFDLGVGILHPFVPRSDEDRRVFINAIGPLWDGNEVWLVTFGGALFAMFPEAYATLFSGFYSAFMALLFCLILRAVSMEFRGKFGAGAWRRVWDTTFFLGSAGVPLLFGVAAGTIMKGIPLDERGEYAGALLDQITPYSLLVGFMTVALFAMHGSIFLYLKTEGDLQKRVHRYVWRTFGLFLVLYLITTMFTLVEVPAAVENFKQFQWLWIVPVLNVLAIANIPRALFQGRPFYAFVSSSCSIAAFVFLFAAALFPNMVRAADPAAEGMTIYHAASSSKTLTIGLMMVLFGMPCVLAYTLAIYWTFRGKVKLGDHSY